MVILNAAAKCSILVSEHSFFTFVDIALALVFVPHTSRSD